MFRLVEEGGRDEPLGVNCKLFRRARSMEAAMEAFTIPRGVDGEERGSALLPSARSELGERRTYAPNPCPSPLLLPPLPHPPSPTPRSRAPLDAAPSTSSSSLLLPTHPPLLRPPFSHPPPQPSRQGTPPHPRVGPTRRNARPRLCLLLSGPHWWRRRRGGRGWKGAPL